jgi:hypothetical protein
MEKTATAKTRRYFMMSILLKMIQKSRPCANLLLTRMFVRRNRREKEKPTLMKISTPVVQRAGDGWSLRNGECALFSRWYRSGEIMVME